jgi:hypothetical protein
MGLTAILVALVPGIPVSVFLSVRRRPRRFVGWPIIFAGACGALAPAVSLVAYIVRHR